MNNNVSLLRRRVEENISLFHKTYSLIEILNFPFYLMYIGGSLPIDRPVIGFLTRKKAFG